MYTIYAMRGHNNSIPVSESKFNARLLVGRSWQYPTTSVWVTSVVEDFCFYRFVPFSETVAKTWLLVSHNVIHFSHKYVDIISHHTQIHIFHSIYKFAIPHCPKTKKENSIYALNFTFAFRRPNIALHDFRSAWNLVHKKRTQHFQLWKVSFIHTTYAYSKIANAVTSLSCNVHRHMHVVRVFNAHNTTGTIQMTFQLPTA